MHACMHAIAYVQALTVLSLRGSHSPSLPPLCSFPRSPRGYSLRANNSDCCLLPPSPPLSLSLFSPLFFPAFSKTELVSGSICAFHGRFCSAACSRGKKAPLPLPRGTRHAAHPPICKTITPRTKMVLALVCRNHRGREKREITDVESRARARAVDREKSKKSASEKQR